MAILMGAFFALLFQHFARIEVAITLDFGLQIILQILTLDVGRSLV